MISTVAHEMPNEYLDYIFLCFLGYLYVAIKSYISLKRAGILNHESLSNRYYRYIVLWPLYHNPFELIAEKIFKRYGDEGHVYPGWGGLKNFMNDRIKGPDRYEGYDHYNFHFELSKSPEPNFKKLKYVLINLSKKGNNILYMSHLSETPLRNIGLSIYDLDKCEPMDHQKLISELQSLNISYQDIETIIQNINKREN